MQLSELPYKDGQVYVVLYHSYALGTQFARAPERALPPPRFASFDEKDVANALVDIFKEYQHWTETTLKCFPEFFPALFVNGRTAVIEFKPQCNPYWTTLQICPVNPSTIQDQLKHILSQLKIYNGPLMPHM